MTLDLTKPIRRKGLNGDLIVVTIPDPNPRDQVIVLVYHHAEESAYSPGWTAHAYERTRGYLEQLFENIPEVETKEPLPNETRLFMEVMDEIKRGHGTGTLYDNVKTIFLKHAYSPSKLEADVDTLKRELQRAENECATWKKEVGRRQERVTELETKETYYQSGLLTTEQARHIAAQVWCGPRTSHIEMNHLLAEAFSATLHRYVNTEANARRRVEDELQQVHLDLSSATVAASDGTNWKRLLQLLVEDRDRLRRITRNIEANLREA